MMGPEETWEYVHESIGGQEGSLVSLAARAAQLEVHGRRALAEVGGGVGAGTGTGISRRVGGGSSGGRGSGGGTSAGGGGGRGRRGRSIGGTGTTSGGTGRSVGVLDTERRGTSVLLWGKSLIDWLCKVGSVREVAEAVGLHDISHALAVGGEGSGQRLGRVGVLNIGAGDIRVDKRQNTLEGSRRRQTRIPTDRGNRLGERVEVLLGGDDADGGLDHVVGVAERLDDLVGELELGSY